MFCQTCGKELENGVEFCEICKKSNMSKVVSDKFFMIAVWLIVALLFIGLFPTFKTKTMPDRNISLSHNWTNDSCSAAIQGTYIYGAETFCFNITTTEKERRVGSVVLYSKENKNIQVVLVEEMREVSYQLGDSDNQYGYANCIEIDSVMFHRVMDGMVITSYKNRKW